MQPSKQLIEQFRRKLDPDWCQQCHTTPVTGTLFCTECRDKIDTISTKRDMLQLDEELPDGIHIVTRRGLAQQNKGR